MSDEVEQGQAAQLSAHQEDLAGAAGAVANAPQRPAPGRRLGLERRDLQLMALLTVVGFVLRFFSPILPDFFAHPFTAPPISNCIKNTPVNPAGDRGTVCGLAYPFQKGTQNATTKQYQPPDGEVFDEIYFGRFPYLDLKGQSYFDDKPPVGKLIIAAGEWSWGWFRATFQGARGGYADLGLTPFGWRLMPMLFGTLLIPLMYLLAHRLWANRLFAGLAAFFTCFDGMFFLQSRIAMLDIFMAFFLALAYWLFLLHLSSRTPGESTLTLLLTGAALGLAVATKWSGLAAWGAILLLLFVWMIRNHVRLDAPQDRSRGWIWRETTPRDSALPSAIPGGDRLGFYLTTAALAFVVIPLVIYVSSWFPFFLRGQFHSLADIVSHDHAAYIFNATLKATHPYGSPWFSWPVLYRPVLYYFQGDLGFDHWTGAPLDAAITDLGNPWIWWTSLPCLLALPYFIFRHRNYAALVIAVAFCAQFLPWSRVTRVLFLFEMGAMLPFMILALAFVLAWISRTELLLSVASFRLRIPVWPVAYAHVGLTLLFFVYFYPIWTGIPIGSHALFDSFPGGKTWFPTWI